MDMKYTVAALSVAMLLTAGCETSGPKESAVSKPAEQHETPLQPVSARIHWLGKRRVATSTNSAGLVRIWREPESARLEAHIIDRLSLAPWHLWHPAADTNAAVLLRPLLR